MPVRFVQVFCAVHCSLSPLLWREISCKIQRQHSLMASSKDQVPLRENHAAEAALSNIGGVHGNHSDGGCKTFF